MELGLFENTLRNWEAAGKIKVQRHHINNFRLFKATDLAQLLNRTEGSAAKRQRKPR